MKGKKKKKKGEAVQIKHCIQREIANTGEELAKPLHGGRKKPISFGSSNKRGSPHIKERIYS